MYILKSESYNLSLSPDQYLEKLQNPRQVISEKGSEEQDKKDIDKIEEVLERSYNDNQKSSEQKELAIK